MAKTSKRKRPIIANVATGVPGLDLVLGGGLPEFSFNLIAGAPGTGKTTLTQQILFANATLDRPAVYFTVLGEPTLKMIRYQQQFDFFDAERVPSVVRFVNLSKEATSEDLDAVFGRIVTEVEKSKPGFITVDSFRTIGGHVRPGGGRDSHAQTELAEFVHRLALQLSSWEVTSFLLGEYDHLEGRHPVFTVADSILWLSDDVERNSAVRKLRALKVRGRAQMPGLHTFRITSEGLEVFPRIPEQQSQRAPRSGKRLGTGIQQLDEMMDGGVPQGDVLILTGPAGSGKTTFAAQFLAQGLIEGERCVVAVFEEFPEAYFARVKSPSVDFRAMVREDRLAVLYLRPLDLSVDEMLAEILQAVERMDATRVVIDSLSGFEIALAPTFRIDFRESMYRLVGALTAVGVTVVMTAEVHEPFVVNSGFASERMLFVTDDILIQRYVEISGRLVKVLAVVKMRGSSHSPRFRRYELTPAGVVLGDFLDDYRGITTGVPTLDPPRDDPEQTP